MITPGNSASSSSSTVCRPVARTESKHQSLNYREIIAATNRIYETYLTGEKQQ